MSDTPYTRIQVPGLPGVYFREMELVLAGRTLSVLSVSAVDLLSCAKDGPIPYWPVAWPAGLALARHLAELPLARARVLEVGCGVGISGLGAALAGADVLVTDNEPPALRLAMMNARRNGIPLRAAAADWRRWPLRERFDTIIGGDVTYHPAAFDALLSVLETALEPGGEVLLTEPGRSLVESFRRRAEARRWRWRTEPLPQEGPQPVLLHRLCR
jgi:predicted nicotinamide N-methyase